MKEMDRLQESTVLAVGIAKHKELPTRRDGLDNQIQDGFIIDIERRCNKRLARYEVNKAKL